MEASAGIDLDQYKTQAKELLRQARAGTPEAQARLAVRHRPARARRTLPSGAASPASPDSPRLADAQRAVAGEHGFASWPRFKDYLLFRNALQALDRGDLERLATLLGHHPALLRYRCRTGDIYEQGYFAGAMLLHHVAGNPDRGPLPRNVLDGARLLIRHGIDGKAARETIGLLLTSRRAAEAGVALQLIDLLVQAGAPFDLAAPDVLDLPLLNAAPATAQALVRRGARMDLRHAAALGEIAALRAMLAAAPPPPAALELALTLACIRGQTAAAALLVRHGAKGDVLVAPGGQTARTALHEAANRGHLDIVKLLLRHGAHPDVVEPRWGGTAAGWADHGGHPEIAALLRQIKA